MFFLNLKQPPKSTPKESSATSDVYKRQISTVFVLFPNDAETKWDQHILIGNNGNNKVQLIDSYEV